MTYNRPMRISDTAHGVLFFATACKPGVRIWRARGGNMWHSALDYVSPVEFELKFMSNKIEQMAA